MLNGSFGEIFLILVIALLVIGPNQLPVVARHIGRFIRYLRNLTTAITHEVSHELNNEYSDNSDPMVSSPLSGQENPIGTHSSKHEN